MFIYDHPGFGVSPRPQRLGSDVKNGGGEDGEDDIKAELDASLSLRASASAALIQYWGLKKPVHVVAHDNGGLVALRLLLQHSIKMASLCLIDVVALGASGLGFFKVVAENHAVFKAIPGPLVEGLVRAYVRSATFNKMSTELEDMLIAPWLEGGSQGSDGFLREMMQAHYRDVGGLDEQYGSVGQMVPTKIIWGREDKWIPVETAEKLRVKLGTEEEVVVIEGAGHLVHYDEPGRLGMEVGLWVCGNCM